MLKWVDVSYMTNNLSVLLYRFTCGNLHCTIRYGNAYRIPQISWECEPDAETCPLNDDQQEFRDLTQNELFHFHRTLTATLSYL